MEQASPDETATTLVQTTRITPSGEPSFVDPVARPLDDAGFAERYEVRATLGEGGMGEVLLTRDRRIGREIAIKVIRRGVGSQSDIRRRFEREARVQGQLEHPAIVPVYDLGIGPGGQAYFTMKRVRGESLDAILADLAKAPADEAARARRRLVSAFHQVCLAIAYAHARGVIHRDLKPANIMLGRFGEVYVLDWGVARLVEGEEIVTSDGERPIRAGETRAGAILGTPGYLSPEQARGDSSLVGSASDVYSLGAILFEILTMLPLHPPRRQEALIAAPLLGADARCRSRAPHRDVPPELEAICVRATELAPEDRYASAREMGDAIERFLDGDRDDERRRELARELAATAHEQMKERGAKGRAVHAEALKNLGRALALDPNQPAAIDALTRLLLMPPEEMPAEAAREHQILTSDANRARGTHVMWALGAWLLTMPVALVMGVKSVAASLVTLATLAGAAVATGIALRSKSTGAWPTALSFAATTAAISASSMCFGPFVVVPALAVVAAVLASMNPRLFPYRGYAVFLAAATMLVPMILEGLGFLPPSMRFVDGNLVLLPRLAYFPPAATTAFLVVANLSLVVVPTLTVSRLAKDADAAEQRLFAHLWQLRQLVPDRAQVAAVRESDDTGPMRVSVCPGDVIARRREVKT